MCSLHQRGAVRSPVPCRSWNLSEDSCAVTAVTAYSQRCCFSTEGTARLKQCLESKRREKTICTFISFGLKRKWRVSVWDDDRVLHTGSGDGCIVLLDVPNATELCT